MASPAFGWYAAQMRPLPENQQAEQGDAADFPHEIDNFRSAIRPDTFVALLIKLATFATLLAQGISLVAHLFMLALYFGDDVRRDEYLGLIFAVGMIVLCAYSIVSAATGYFRSGALFTRRTATRTLVCALAAIAWFVVFIFASIGDF